VDSPIAHYPNSHYNGNLVDIVEIQPSTSDIRLSAGSASSSHLKLRGYLFKILPGPFIADGILPDCRDDVDEAHHFCLPLCLQETTRGQFLCGVILRRVEEAWDHSYKRVGMFRFVEGDSVHLLGHGEWHEAHVFGERPGDILDSATLSRNIII